MQSSEHIISRIIDLDSNAERIRVQAREEAARMRREAVVQAEEKKLLLDGQTAAKAAKIEEDAIIERSREVARVKKEHADQAEAIRAVSAAKMDRVVQMVISGMKGRSE